MVDISFLRKNGYQVLRGFLPYQKMNSIRSYLVNEKENTLKKIKSHFYFSSEEQLVETIGKLLDNLDEFNALDEDLKQWLSGHFPRDVRLSSKVLSLMECSQIKDLYSALFPGEDPKVHLPPVLRFVLPHNPYAAVPPHQDISYNKHMGDFFVMWTPFCSIDSKRGGVELFEGTQNYPEQLEKLDRQFWLEGLEMSKEPIHFDMEMGDVLVFNRFLIHQSRANMSNKTRISGDFRLFSGHSSKHYLNLNTKEICEPKGEVFA